MVDIRVYKVDVRSANLVNLQARQVSGKNEQRGISNARQLNLFLGKQKCHEKCSFCHD